MSHHKEIAKYLKLISARKLEKKHKECIELYNVVGGLYSEICNYDEAAHYHEKALEVCTTIGDRLATARTFRYIGEAKAASGDFPKATECVKKYLDLVQKLNDKVEIQRAWTTLGRIYLMQAQELKDKNLVIDKVTREAAREAEKKFQTALTLAESVRDKVENKEYAQMISGLLQNIGSIKDICGQHAEAISKLNRAAETARGAKLKEDLHRCQMMLSAIHRQRNDVKMAVKTSEEALQTAKSIGKKILICEALIERGQVRICQRDFKNAKRTFAQAYLEKSPNEEDHSKAIRLTKLTHLVTVNYEKLSKDDTPSDSRLKLCDKLGDLFIAIGNYKLAIEFYRRAYSDAKVCSKPKADMAKILYSLGETYADDGQFKHALVCYQKELACREDNAAEQCQSLIKIAHMHEYQDEEPAIVSEAYEKALEKADKDPKLMHSVLRYYVPYLRQKSLKATRYSELSDKLKNLKSYPEVVEESEAEDCEESTDLEDEVANVDDVITDDDDNDEVLMVGRRRARGGKKFKADEMGNTPLHEAAIKGDFKRVKSLVTLGHDINPRDNAGWIPIHEAANYGHFDIVEYLIERGGDVNNRGMRGMSPLHDAASNGHFEVMRLLIKHGANVISLTDEGETVLSCLRDHKVREGHLFSNSKLSEYKQMEAELMNIMDKCGYNLMSENIKSLGTRSGSSRRVSSALVDEKVSEIQHRKSLKPQPARHNVPDETPVVRSGARVSLTSAKSDASSVKEYREAITTLKRKRPLAVTQPSKKVNQPATITTNSDTSIPTKNWLLSDDVIEEEEDDDEDNEVLEIPKAKTTRGRAKTIMDDDDDDDVRLIEESTKTNEQPSTSHEQPSSLDSSDIISQSPTREHSPVLTMEDWDGSLSPIAEVQPSIKDTPSKARSKTPNSMRSSHSALLDRSTPFDLSNRPLTVTIEGRKLLIPIKEEYMTIGELKRTVVERYSILINAKPTISLAPVSDPDCFLFDHDLCRDVVTENLVAKIDSWQLESIEATYLSECCSLQIEPLNFVKLEMRDLDEKEHKLDFSYRKFPRSHLKPIIQALARRHFSSVSFQGSNLWFECRRVSQELLASTLFTWNRLTRLNMKCAGLLRSHFEILCNSKSELPELEHIDVSVNSIAYRTKKDFTTQVEKLWHVCSSLKRLDVRKNHLLFVKSLACDSSSTGATLLDISPALGLCGFEILAGDQYEYSVY